VVSRGEIPLVCLPIVAAVAAIVSLAASPFVVRVVNQCYQKSRTNSSSLICPVKCRELRVVQGEIIHASLDVSRRLEIFLHFDQYNCSLHGA
jgi:hypothetical protein